jgi:glycosyltransferase involved in cell wall biosynthesis
VPALPVTVIVPVLNEEANLPAALASLRWADEIIVVDSGSTDRTVELAEEAGARVLQFRYDGKGPKKKEWTLEHVEPGNEWLFFLDGDERVTPELRAEIERTVADPTAVGFYVDRELVFMGRPMRSFRPNWNMRLFRRGHARIERLGVTNLPATGDNEIHEHFIVDGPSAYLSEPLLHDDYRGLTAWLDRHNKYATWEAHLYRRFRAEPIGVGVLGFLRLDPFQRKRVLRRIWVRLPLRSPLRFLIWYVFRRGFLDGREGFLFCVFMGYHEFVIGAKVRELELVEASVPQ